MMQSSTRARPSRRVHPKPAPLAVTHPEFAAEWHPSKNGDLSPHDISYGSARRVWWQCRENPSHEWSTRVNHRTLRNSHCPFCYDPYRPLSGKTVADVSPKVASEWHPTKNGDRTPSEVGYGSKQRAWWICSVCEHEWETVISERVRTGGCPSCSGQTVTEKNSLRALRPDLVPQWHPELNGVLTPDGITAKSKKAVWWRCLECPYVWASAPEGRSRGGTSCPSCSGQHLTEFNNLAARHPGIVKEWHSELNGELTPEMVTSGSPRKVWWLCLSCGMEYAMEVGLRTGRGSGCPGCNNRKDLAAKHAANAAIRRKELAGVVPRKKKRAARDPWDLEGRQSAGERIRAYRMHRGRERGRPMSIVELGERSGLGKNAVADIELGRRSPRPSTLERLAHALEAPLAYIVHGELPPKVKIEGAAV